ncbi:MAG: NUDIX domain-containing protein, partial [Culicoidibacterales bacterium]
YSSDPYALDNYELLAQSAQQMLHRYSEKQITPRDLYVEFEYPTPQPAIRTLIVNEVAEILLVQEQDSGNWSLPGGWVDVNSTPAHDAVKEVAEESGYECEVERLLAVYDRNQYLETQSVYDILCFYFSAKITGGTPKPNHETITVGWFSLANLPELSRKNTKFEIEHAYQIWKNNLPTYCD